MKTFLFSYPFDGSRWSFEIMAENADEAEARLKAISGWSKYDGELVAKIPAIVPLSIFSLAFKLFAWMRPAPPDTRKE